MIVVIGRHNSGKSRLAEDLAVKTGFDRRYYIATMIVYDEEGRERIKKHRREREGKGFVTLEIPYGVDGVTETIDHLDSSVILLECMSNLVGNEIYENSENLDLCKPGEASPDTLIDRIEEEIIRLSKSAGELIVVTNEYDKHDVDDEMTLMYIDCLDRINERLMSAADKIYDLRKT